MREIGRIERTRFLIDWLLDPALHLMASAMTKVRRKGFEATFQMSDGTIEVLLDDLRADALVMVLAPHHRPHDNLRSAPVHHDELVLVVHCSHRLAGREVVSWHVLTGKENQNEAQYGLVRANRAVGIMPHLYRERFMRYTLVPRCKERPIYSEKPKAAPKRPCLEPRRPMPARGPAHLPPHHVRPQTSDRPRPRSRRQ